MKTIRYTKEFTRPDGFPFYVSNPDPAVQESAVAQAVAQGKQVAHVPQIPARFFADVIIWFMNKLPFEMDEKGQPIRKQNAESMGNNYSVIKAFRHVIEVDTSTIELDEPVHTWLLEQVRLEGPTAFGNSQPEVASRLNDVIPEKSSKTSETEP